MVPSKSAFRVSIPFLLAELTSGVVESRTGLSVTVFPVSGFSLLGDGDRDAGFHGFRAKFDNEPETDLTFIPRSGLSSRTAVFGGLYVVSSGLRSRDSVNFDMVIFGWILERVGFRGFRFLASSESFVLKPTADDLLRGVARRAVSSGIERTFSESVRLKPIAPKVGLGEIGQGKCV